VDGSGHGLFEETISTLKSTTFWDITPCSPLKVNRIFEGTYRSACHLSPWYLVRLFFDPEDGGDMFLRKLVDFKRTKRRYNPEHNVFHNHRCENLKSYISALPAWTERNREILGFLSFWLNSMLSTENSKIRATRLSTLVWVTEYRMRKGDDRKKRFERTLVWTASRSYPCFHQEILRKTTDTLFWIAGSSAEVRTSYLWNESLHCGGYNLLSSVTSNTDV
jgi:hypothetical protein